MAVARRWAAGQSLASRATRVARGKGMGWRRGGLPALRAVADAMCGGGRLRGVGVGWMLTHLDGEVAKDTGGRILYGRC